MLPEVGASELVVLAAVALIVVGPKDLPVLLRKVGQFVAKLRGFAADFRSSFDEMARQSELDELRKEVEALRSTAYVDTASVTQTWDEAHHALQPAHESASYLTPSDPEIQAGYEAHGIGAAPSILPPPAPEAPAVAETAKPAKASTRKAATPKTKAAAPKTQAAAAEPKPKTPRARKPKAQAAPEESA